MELNKNQTNTNRRGKMKTFKQHVKEGMDGESMALETLEYKTSIQ